MTFWKEAQGWTYHVYEVDTPVKEFGVFEPLVELWQSKFQDLLLPAWKDFSFEDFDGWYGRLRVGDFMPGRTDDFVYRLWGGKSVDLYGVDLTGKRMSELDFGFDEDDKNLLTMLATEKKITLASGPVFWQEREHLRVQIIKMPLSDDGLVVDKFLGALHRES
ncbi:MAG: hypothetical protein HOC63_14065 [Rhodospirillales bacterium]|jgi:hypothetical protein|nr:hypothetical protein [Rhodospirillales bacterium]MBT4041614.1 hypothetical protein [Rhodospirillales bacterium]MBT4627802.1 hypothetical protein [Rhodospirillales bacterium]MBT5352762.1 hypothetical protein [Rhodospirillales bacterium]MBT5520742.1 hypothetical protein [Rhodospirillales bacterium]